MDFLWITCGFIALLAGLAGSVLPLPGPPLSFLGMFLIHWSRKIDFSNDTLWTFGILTLIVTLLDFIVPALGQKKFGGSKMGIIGGMVGMFLGMAGGIAGMLAGTFLGGLIGELFAGRDGQQAFKASLGSFIGFIFGSLLKMLLCLAMLWVSIFAFF